MRFMKTQIKERKPITKEQAKRRAFWKNNIVNTSMAALPFLEFLLFGLFPMVVCIILSFTELHSYNLSRAEWVGFDNYERLWNERSMIKLSIRNTLIFASVVPIRLVLNVWLSNALYSRPFGHKFFRVILFIPQVISGVAITLAWQWIFEENYGVLNTLLAAVGLPKIPFFTNEQFFRPATIIIALYGSATNVIMLEGNFAVLDKSLMEAARLDGANERQVFWHVKFPQLTPTLFYLLTMGLIGAMQEQAIMQVLTTNGMGPNNSAITLTYYIYKMAFTWTATDGFGMACALSVVTGIIITVLIRLNFAFGKKWVHYD